jgi:CHRD domain
MKHRLLVGFAGVASLLVLTGAPALADGARTRLEGFQETPLTLSTTGQGRCVVKINEAETEIAVTVSYSDLVGSVTQSHIHLGQRALSGGVSLFLCTNLGNGPAGTPACPPAPASVTRTLTAADVIGPAAQGIAAGELDKIIEAIRTGNAYCNVHSTVYPGGEIRGQLRPRHSDHED